jgi:pSer/pThr/pTyr-binding forkhead associated (FHA) protein
MSRIVVNLLAGSSLEGSRLEFDAESVTLGRHPENDVAFDPHRDRVVSSHHARIQIESGAGAPGEGAVWFEDLDSSNGSFINGERITGRRRLRLGDEIVLGKKGAVMTVYAPMMGDESGNIATSGALSEGGGRRRRTFGSGRMGRDTVMGMLADVTKRERGRTRRIIIAASLVFGLGFLALFGGFSWFLSGGADDIVRDAARREAEVTARDAAESTARDTARGVAERAAQEQVAELSRTFEDKLAAAGRTFQDVFPEVEKSVYPVFVKRKVDGTTRVQSGGGTCWVVAPGVLATNAHVAEQHRPPFASLMVRTADPIRDLEVERIEIHPGYRLWAKLQGEYQPIDPGGSKFIRFIPACDVALLHLRPQDQGAIGQPLPIASDTELAGLSRGTPAAFLGYPVEGTVVGALERSEASSDVGPISQVLDFFLEPNDTERERLVTYNLKAEGGASGSPVFGLDGKVVAVHSAGNFKFLAGQRISQGGTAFGQRVDLVRELLEKKAEARTREIEGAWRGRLLTLWQKVHEPEAAMRAFRGRLNFPGSAKVFRKKLASGSLATGATQRVSFDMGKTRGWVVAAMVTGAEFGTLGMRGAVTSLPKSWLVLGQGRKSGAQAIDVYRPQGAGGDVDFEVWVFYGS